MNPAAGGGRIGGLIIGTRTGSRPGGGGGIRIPAQHTHSLLAPLPALTGKTLHCFACQSTIITTFPSHSNNTTTTTILRPFFRDHPGEPVPEENFWTLWFKGRLTEADTPTIRLGCTPSGLTSAYLNHPTTFYRPDALPAAQPTVTTVP